jgi:hypothetical protein
VRRQSFRDGLLLLLLLVVDRWAVGLPAARPSARPDLPFWWATSARRALEPFRPPDCPSSSHSPHPHLSLLLPRAMPPSGLRLLRQLVYLAVPVLLVRYLFFGPSQPTSSAAGKTTASQLLASRNANKGAGIQAHGVIDRLRADKGALDVHRFPFLQSRMGRDDRPDLFDAQIALGVADYWERFSKPWITGQETAHLDAQVVRGAIDELLSFNGWVTVRDLLGPRAPRVRKN